MKVLCLCQGGNVRSVALAYLLKYGADTDALACSWQKNTPETIQMLCEWADAIALLESSFKVHVPTRYHDKIAIFDVGPDRWGNPLHPDLIALLTEMVNSREPAMVGA